MSSNNPQGGPVDDSAVATDRDGLLVALGEYRRARRSFLASLGCHSSNRDPLAEFAERLAVSVLGGQLALNRVQKGYDFEDEEGNKVQVKYLANSSGRWVNEHEIDFRSGCDRWALLIVEDLDAKSLVVFSKSGLRHVCAALGKRHSNQDLTLQLTQANYRAIANSPERFEPWGVAWIDLTRSRREKEDTRASPGARRCTTSDRADPVTSEITVPFDHQS